MTKTVRTQLEAWAIRQKSTGLFLPARSKQHGRERGFSHDEPSGGLPRLFSRPAYAKLALGAWLQGVWSRKLVLGYLSESEPEEGLVTETVAGRRADDMEVVKVILMVEVL